MPYTFDPHAMDLAAKEAAHDLADRIKAKNADYELALQIVADWMQDYYRTAGYKRLAKILLQYKSNS